jgi:ligand-binding sensor domain-containing protein/serine phosphatase RsbU (regulator of sigma subunit)
MKILHCIFLLVLASCSQHKTAEIPLPGKKRSAVAATGVIMSGSKIEAPIVITAGKSKPIKAGEPKVTAIPPNTGNAGGFSIMQNFTTENGLPIDIFTRASCCDKKGNLWFGTEGGGACRYDGKSFTNFTIENGLASNSVWSIMEDRDGNIWFGTEGGGVSKYDGHSFTNYNKQNGLADNRVWSILQDRKGNMWFGTLDGGASKFDGKTFTTYRKTEGLPDMAIRNITEDKDGNIWFATDGGGVSKFDGKTFTNYKTDQGLAHNTVVGSAVDDKGNLWFGTYGGGLSRFGQKKFTTFTTEQGLSHNDVRSITKISNGDLWFCTLGRGVSKYSDTSFTNYSKAQGLSNNAIWSVTEDKNGNLWFGSYGAGLCRYDGPAFINYTRQQGLPHNVCWSILEDKNGAFWFGTYGGGLCKYDGASFSSFGKEQGLPFGDIRCIVQDKEGNLWFGTFGAGICKYDGHSFTRYTIEEGLCNNVPICASIDSKGNIWFGTAGGLSRFDGTAFTNYMTGQGLVNNAVNCILEDKDGNFWFGTDGGLSKYDGKLFTSYTEKDGITNNIITCLREDESGNIWIGTYGGLCRFDGKSFLSWGKGQGLPDNTITQIAFTKKKQLVAGTNVGFAMLRGFTGAGTGETKPLDNKLSNNELEQHTLIAEIFNSSTGYPVKNINFGCPTVLCDSKGILWLATGSDKTGVVRFDESAMKQNLQPPCLELQNLNVNGETVCWYDLMECDSATFASQEMTAFGKTLGGLQRDSIRARFRDIEFSAIKKFYPLPENLVLPYADNNLSFEWNAIETGRHFLVRYQFMLEGYDKEWSSVTDKDRADYGNIDEGTYTFRVKARSPAGVWSEPLAYSFRVLPPWYRTWWMYSLYVILSVLLVWIIIRLNGKRLRKQSEMLRQKVNEATTEIREQKNIIEEKHKAITDSINYAERIQKSFLATKELLDENLRDYFVFFQPRDVVSGDFYWASKLKNGQFALVTADSTGHGVPGAIMSLLNITSLENSVEHHSDPAEILNSTRRTIIDRLKKDGSAEGGKDGMDCSLVSFDFNNNSLSYAAANNPVWIIRNGEIIELVPDKMPVGKHDKDSIGFTQHTVQLQRGDVVYTLTDGMPDQFGGPKGKKFMYAPLKNLLISISQLSPGEQKKRIGMALNEWRGNLEQVDDITIIGVRI